MKRPDMMVVFGPIHSSPEAVAEQWLSFILDELEGNLGSYFARLEFDNEEGEYDFVDEVLDLKDRDELLRRVATERNCMWKFRVPFGFANADVYTALFSDPEGQGNEVTLLLRIEPSITRFVEDEEVTRRPFTALLIRAAHAIQAPWLLTGLHLPWKPLSKGFFLQGGGGEAHAYVAAWQPELLEAGDLLERWGLYPQQVMQSVLGYDVVTRFPTR